MSELTFAGALAGHRIPLVCRPGQLPVYAEADFCIQGSIDPTKMLPEGPFGDHLGYYSLQHEFPYLRVERVTCRDRRHLAVYGGGSTAPGRHGLRPIDPRTHSTGHPHGRSRGPRRACRRCGGRASAHAGDRQRTLRTLRTTTPAAGIADTGQRDPGPGPDVAVQVLVDRRPAGRSRIWTWPMCRRSFSTCWRVWTGDETSTSRPAPRSTPWITPAPP